MSLFLPLSRADSDTRKTASSISGRGHQELANDYRQYQNHNHIITGVQLIILILYTDRFMIINTYNPFEITQAMYLHILDFYIYFLPVIP